MLSTIKPIIVPLSGLDDIAGTYLQYSVRMLYNSDSVGGVSEEVLYYGKSFVDADGETEIHLEKVLRDYLFRWKCELQPSSQLQRPACLISSFGQRVLAVEASQRLFWNTKIAVVYEYNATEQREVVDVCGAWCPQYQKLGAINGALEDVAVFDYVQTYATLATSVPPHIPPISTANFWLGLVLNINKGAEADVGSIAIGASSVDNVAITYRHGGTYAMAITLMQLFAELSSSAIDGGDAGSSGWYDEIDGGDTETAYDGEYDGGTSDDSAYAVSTMPGATLSLYWDVAGVLHSVVAAVVDVCPKPFYVAWITPTGGWTSFGMDGNVVFAVQDTPTAIVDLNGSDDVLEVKEEATIRLWSGIVNKETYAHLMTMLQSRLLYVYDSERDEGWYCTAKTNNAATLPSKNGRSQAFQVELKTINNNEQ